MKQMKQSYWTHEKLSMERKRNGPQKSCEGTDLNCPRSERQYGPYGKHSCLIG